MYARSKSIRFVMPTITIALLISISKFSYIVTAFQVSPSLIPTITRKVSHSSSAISQKRIHISSTKTPTKLWQTDDSKSSVETASQATKDVESKAARTKVLNKAKDPPKAPKKQELKTVSARYVDDNGLVITTDKDGAISARPSSVAKPVKQKDTKALEERATSEKKTQEKVDTKEKDIRGEEGEKEKSDKLPAIKKTSIKKRKRKISTMKIKRPQSSGNSTVKRRRKLPISLKRNESIHKKATKFLKEEIPKPIISGGGFNVVLTHCTADFDSLASAVGLAKLWSNQHPSLMGQDGEDCSSEFQSSSMLPTFVVLPRGAHPAVQRFLALHKHLFPIRSLRSLPSDLSGLNRLGLVDAQRRERVGPAEHLISYADRVTIVDHHIEGDSDIPEATDYVVDKVGSVSAMIAEQLKEAGFELSEAEATLLALGIHADTGSLCYDSTTTRDAEALAWVMKQGASQAAIAEHAHSTLSHEQQGVLTNALINTNSTIVHGVTVSTVLLW